MYFFNKCKIHIFTINKYLIFESLTIKKTYINHNLTGNIEKSGTASRARSGAIAPCLMTLSLYAEPSPTKDMQKYIQAIKLTEILIHLTEEKRYWPPTSNVSEGPDCLLTDMSVW